MNIVIVGGGAGGLELATRLGKSLGQDQYNIVLVDAQIAHLWKPRLHEVAAGVLNSELAEVNYFAHAKRHHFNFVLGKMDGIDRDKKYITLASLEDESGEILPNRTLSYDYLVLAVGSQTNDYGAVGAAEYCLYLDSKEAAEKFQKLFFNTFLQASQHQSTDGADVCSDDEGKIFEIAIVGGGATGVELAAELKHAADGLGHYGLGGIKRSNLRITIIEASDRLLPQLSVKASAIIYRQLEEIGVDVRLNEYVVKVDELGLTTKSGDYITASLKVWSAGIKAPKFLSEMQGLPYNRLGQLKVNPQLQTLDPAIFAFGDCAACPQSEEDETVLVPPRAAAANQQATLLAKSFVRIVKQKTPLTFRYDEKGSLISLSKKGSVADIVGTCNKGLTFEGRIARWFYVTLYRMHQIVLHGYLYTFRLILKDTLVRSTSPNLKLH